MPALSGGGFVRTPTPSKINFAILTYNALEWTKVCLASIAHNTPFSHNIFVLDNVSRDGTQSYLSSLDQENLFFEAGTENLGVPGGRNRLIDIITPHLPDDGFVIFLDNDMELLPGWADPYLALFADNPKAGIASAHGHRMVVYGTRRELLPHPPYSGAVEVACGGFCCWIRAQTIRDVGYFDTNLGLFWHEDDDYSLRAVKAGYQVFSLPHVGVVHHEHKSGVATPTIQQDGSPKNQAYLAEKWRKLDLVDQQGRIRHQASLAELPCGRRELSPGIRADAVSRDRGGYRWIGPSCNLEVTSRSAQRLELELALGDQSLYPQLPLEVQIFINDERYTTLTFRSSGERQRLVLPLPSDSQCSVRIVSSSAFSPALWPAADELADPWALMLCRAQFCNDAVTAPNAPEAGAQSDTVHPPSAATAPLATGVWVSPLFSTNPAATATQLLLASIEQSGFALRALSTNERVSEAVRGSPWYPRYYTTLTRARAGGPCVIASDPLDAHGQNLYAQVRALYPDHTRYVALVCDVPEQPNDAWCSAFRQIDEVWAPTEELCTTLSKLLDRPVRQLPLPLAEYRREPCPPLVEADHVILARIRPQHEAALARLLRAYQLAFSPQHSVCLMMQGADGALLVASDLLQQALGAEGLSSAPTAKILSLDATLQAADPHCVLASVRAVLHTGPQPMNHLAALAYGAPVMQIGGTSTALPEEAGEIDDSETLARLLRRMVLDQNLRTEALVHQQAFLTASPSTTESVRFLQEFTSRFADTSRIVAREAPRAPVPAKLPTEIIEATPSPTTLRTHGASPLIAIDARTLTYPQNTERGIGHYTMHHLAAVFESAPHWRFALLVDDEAHPELIEKLRRFPNVSTGRLAQFPEDASLFHIPDPITILPGYDSPFRVAPHTVPYSMVFYDLIPLVRRDMHLDAGSEFTKRAYFQRLEQIRASHVHAFAISENTRQDLHQLAGVPLDRITTIMAGLNESGPAPDEATVQRTLTRLGLHHPFFISVGGIDPHKDFTTTLQAFLTLSAEQPVQFAVIGSERDPYKAAFREYLQKQGVKNVVFTGFLSKEELACCYRAARGLSFPSLYEGFGFPVLEAMAAGCPVITTDVSSLPEVAGEAAILVPPGDAAAVLDGMRKLCNDPAFRNELIQRGYRQAASFTWRSCAEKTIAGWCRLMQIEHPAMQQAGERNGVTEPAPTSSMQTRVRSLLERLGSPVSLLQ